MTPLLAHNALAAVVEMYREALQETTLRIAALTSENAMLRKELESSRAVQVQKAASVDVRQQSGDGQEVGEAHAGGEGTSGDGAKAKERPR